MFLQKGFQSAAGRSQALLRPTNMSALRATTAISQRPYFSVFEKIKDRFRSPLRHIESFAEPDGYASSSQMPEGYRLHGNSAASFSASMTQNSIELNQWHEMEATVHSQFGTVDNPVLIFTSDSSWRIVICMGPGIEDDSHSHEKIFYMVREGPINRCQVCGQCFKIVRLKDEFSEEQDYYTMMFSTLSHFDVSEEDMAVPVSYLAFFGDRPSTSLQTIPATNVYIHVNPDEADRILVDPAYKLERLKEAHEKLYAMHEAYRAVDKQMATQRIQLPVPFGRDLYETWYDIEKSISKFDRLFNKVEKFNARKLSSDPATHARRERRMQERKKTRNTDNFTFFLGNMTEEEQQYRDYFETDLENDPEDEYIESRWDEEKIANSGQFDPKLYDFLELSMISEIHENFQDIVEDKIFKFKYRQNADAPAVFKERNERMISRFLERAKTRDPAIEQNINQLYFDDSRDSSVAAYMVDHENYRETAEDETRAWREYIAKEGVQQYRDYYEDAAEEHGFFEYLDNLSNRDQIRFMECFTDYTQDRTQNKGHILIPKREFNPELSSFSNFLLDLVDFRDRVRPMASDLARFDASLLHQKRNVDELEAQMREFKEGISEGTAQAGGEEVQSVEEGYSSLEIAAESEADAEPEAAEPDLEAAAEAAEEEAPAEEAAEEAAEEEPKKKDE